MLGLSACTKVSRAERLLKKHMYQTAYDYNSYEPIETEVRKSNHSIWFNLQAISTAKEVVEEYNETHTSFNALDDNDVYDVYMLISEHLSEFGEYHTLETNVYDGYSVLHKFRIKNRLGISNIYRIKYIVDKNFKTIVASYSTPEDYIGTMSESYVLGKVHDVYRAKRSQK